MRCVGAGRHSNRTCAFRAAPAPHRAGWHQLSGLSGRHQACMRLESQPAATNLAIEYPVRRHCLCGYLRAGSSRNRTGTADLGPSKAVGFGHCPKGKGLNCFGSILGCNRNIFSAVAQPARLQSPGMRLALSDSYMSQKLVYMSRVRSTLAMLVTPAASDIRKAIHPASGMTFSRRSSASRAVAFRAAVGPWHGATRQCPFGDCLIRDVFLSDSIASMDKISLTKAKNAGEVTRASASILLSDLTFQAVLREAAWQRSEY